MLAAWGGAGLATAAQAEEDPRATPIDTRLLAAPGVATASITSSNSSNSLNSTIAATATTAGKAPHSSAQDELASAPPRPAGQTVAALALPIKANPAANAPTAGANAGRVGTAARDSDASRDASEAGWAYGKLIATLALMVLIALRRSGRR